MPPQMMPKSVKQHQSNEHFCNGVTSNFRGGAALSAVESCGHPARADKGVPPADPDLGVGSKWISPERSLWWL